MAKMRQPKDLDKYEPVEDIANQLQFFAGMIRRHGGMAKFRLKLSLWNNDWLDPTKPKPNFILTSAELGNNKQKP